MKFDVITDHRCRLGEGPTWDDRRNRLFWVDIEGAEVLSVAPDGSDLKRTPLPDRVGSMGLTESGRLVLALTKKVVILDLDSGAFTTIAEIETDNPHTRLNDGKVGPDGAFWVGSMDERPERQPIGALYRVTADGRVETKVEGLKVSNGLAWDHKGTTMFHSDSRAAVIDRWDFDVATGAISNRVQIRGPIANEDGRPDGAAGDAEGCYWSAGVSAGLLNRYDRDGNLLLSVPVPVAAPTMPCFGGPDLRTLYLTSLTEGQPAEKLAAYPETGKLIAARAPVAGAPVARMKD
jgi:sugar lactone lactonase YvrE